MTNKKMKLLLQIWVETEIGEQVISKKYLLDPDSILFNIKYKILVTYLRFKYAYVYSAAVYSRQVIKY